MLGSQAPVGARSVSESSSSFWRAPFQADQLFCLESGGLMGPFIGIYVVGRLLTLKDPTNRLWSDIWNIDDFQKAATLVEDKKVLVMSSKWDETWKQVFYWDQHFHQKCLVSCSLKLTKDTEGIGAMMNCHWVSERLMHSIGYSRDFIVVDFIAPWRGRCQEFHRHPLVPDIWVLHDRKNWFGWSEYPRGSHE